MQALGGARRDHPLELGTWHDRVELGRPSRDDDLGGMDVEHEGRGADDEQRPRIDPDHLVTLRRIEHEDTLPGTLSGRGGLPAAVASPDDGNVDVRAQHLDVRPSQ